uniref:Uncharacterized protein n=1 Tax=Oryza punctata TaxID=4537 RepID=A0A0E0L1N6_ORYPU
MAGLGAMAGGGTATATATARVDVASPPIGRVRVRVVVAVVQEDGLEDLHIWLVKGSHRGTPECSPQQNVTVVPHAHTYSRTHHHRGADLLISPITRPGLALLGGWTRKINRMSNQPVQVKGHREKEIMLHIQHEANISVNTTADFIRILASDKLPAA